MIRSASIRFTPASWSASPDGRDEGGPATLAALTPLSPSRDSRVPAPSLSWHAVTPPAQVRILRRGLSGRV